MRVKWLPHGQVVCQRFPAAIGRTQNGLVRCRVSKRVEGGRRPNGGAMCVAARPYPRTCKGEGTQILPYLCVLTGAR